MWCFLAGAVDGAGVAGALADGVAGAEESAARDTGASMANRLNIRVERRRLDMSFRIDITTPFESSVENRGADPPFGEEY